MRIVVLNVGTGTAKAAVFDTDGQNFNTAGRHVEQIEPGANRERAILATLEGVGASDSVDAIGHRVVHGGTRFIEPTLITAEVESFLKQHAELAPLHNPAALDGIRVARKQFPKQPAVAMFDTAFHAQRSEESLAYALPREIVERLGLRRYGFHGIAHASLVNALAAAQHIDSSRVSGVTLQLGSGCSACAIDDGRSVETSMGFSPLEGFMMQTRSGSIDPQIVVQLVRAGYKADEIETLLTRHSGLLGLCGTHDMRKVLSQRAAGDSSAALAISMFTRQVALTVGAYFTLLGGKGALVFGGGIGENSREIRTEVSALLAAWNIELDERLNTPGQRGRISTVSSRPVYVLETQEEALIARATYDTLRTSS